MAQKILIVHGFKGSDSPHWQAWLAAEIARDYGYVHFLKFQDSNYPHLSAWRNELLDALEEFQPDLVICHSVACSLWFHLCEEKSIQVVQNLILVAPPSMRCDIVELKSFFPLITPRTLFANKALLIVSDNDPYMPLEEAKQLQNELQIEMKVLAGAGHINAESNYGEWPWLLEHIKSLESR